MIQMSHSNGCHNYVNNTIYAYDGNSNYFWKDVSVCTCLFTIYLCNYRWVRVKLLTLLTLVSPVVGVGESIVDMGESPCWLISAIANAIGVSYCLLAEVRQREWTERTREYLVYHFFCLYDIFFGVDCHRVDLKWVRQECTLYSIGCYNWGSIAGVL